MFQEILREELGRESVFRDAGKLLPDHVPERLPHREDQFRELTSMFKPLLESGASQRVLITGSVGVGKTVLAQRFGREVEKLASSQRLELSYFHLNCRVNRTPYAVLLALVQHYNPKGPSRGLGGEKLLAMVVDYLDEHDALLVLGLDEIDHFVRINGPDLLYSLTRAWEERRTPNRVSIVAIARDKGFLRSVDAATQSTFMHNVVTLDRYTVPQLADILNYRISEAFKAKAVTEDTISLIADIAARWGDARLALELLWRAGMLADEGASDVVLPEHARAAKAAVYPELRKETLLELQPHERLLLLALARRLRIYKQAFAETGELERSYRVVCEEFEQRPRGHTQLWGYLRRMESLGLIDVRPSIKPPRGQTRRISLQEAPAKLLEEELERVLGRNPA